MLRGWKLTVFGVVIVGATAVIAPLLHLVPFAKTIPLFILFLLFVSSLEIMEWTKRRVVKSKKHKKTL
ncbi:hypothetical protein Back11_56740 [Paenibacillus baekrokdamisoli]|uniref:Uncharacterized protein n=1 Tax=Paenibacillus baekrokdamisoli TaxID=1712516 RepID=A0A3G9JMR4_9BACL|nr:hypothetical protein [Paenibacillus baekrokdamisoli]MBB3073165.1 Sec-independent protein secretion pathway component TatC [Paenibacillus baekrokdamisoli]BBH24329.1 hypothetical protein Back11_56740 [Paenibacillus baekrokdamisoli]